MIDVNELRDQYECEFDKLKRCRKDFKKCIKYLIDDICEAVVTVRVKKVEEFINKSQRDDKNYTDPINQITDQIGIRVVVAYRDYEDAVAERLNEELAVDPENSRKTKEDLEEQEFGYLATHIVATLPYEIAEKFSLKDLTYKKFEVQIRTRLNDAWAERSHELIYKKGGRESLKRNLAAVAAILEMLDEEYVRLRKTSNQNITENEFQKALAKEPISTNTLSTFLSSAAVITELRTALKNQGITLTTTVRDKFLPSIANDLRRKGAIDVDQATKFFEEHKQDLTKAIKLYLDSNNRTKHNIDTALTAGMAIVTLEDEPFKKRTEGWTDPWKSGVQAAYAKFHK